MAGGFTQSTRVPVPANGTSAVIFAPVLSWVTVDPAPGVSVEVEWTRDTLAAINANTAVWANWNLGVVSSSSSNKRDTPELNCYVRAITTVTNPSRSTTCTLEVLVNPGALIPELTPQWQSQGNTGGGGAGVSAWWVTPATRDIKGIRDAVTYASTHGWLPIILEAGQNYDMGTGLIPGVDDEIFINPPAGQAFTLMCFGQCAFVYNNRDASAGYAIRVLQSSSGGMLNSRIEGIIHTVVPAVANVNAKAIKITGATGLQIRRNQFSGIDVGVLKSNTFGGSGGTYWTEFVNEAGCYFSATCLRPMIYERDGNGRDSFHGCGPTEGTIINLNAVNPGIDVTSFGAPILYNGKADCTVFGLGSAGPCTFIRNQTSTTPISVSGIIRLESNTARRITLGESTSGGTILFAQFPICNSMDTWHAGSVSFARGWDDVNDGSVFYFGRLGQGSQDITPGDNVFGSSGGVAASQRVEGLSTVWVTFDDTRTLTGGAIRTTYDCRYKLTAGRGGVGDATTTPKVEIVSEFDPVLIYSFDTTKVDIILNTIDLGATGATVVTARPLRLGAAAGAPTGLIDGGTYYPIIISQTATTCVISLAANATDAYDGLNVLPLTSTGADPMTLTAEPYGHVGDGGITFSVTGTGTLHAANPGWPLFGVTMNYEVQQLGSIGRSNSPSNPQIYHAVSKIMRRYFDDTKVNLGLNVINPYNGLGMTTGDKAVLTAAFGAPSPLANGGIYWCRPTASGLKLCATKADAIANNPIVLLTAGTGAMSLLLIDP